MINSFVCLIWSPKNLKVFRFTDNDPFLKLLNASLVVANIAYLFFNLYKLRALNIYKKYKLITF